MRDQIVNAAEAPFPRISVHNSGSELTIEVQWQRMFGFWILGGTVLYVGALFFVLFIEVGKEFWELSSIIRTVSPAILIPTLIASVAILVMGIAFAVNKTRITASSQQVKFGSGPIWIGSQKIVNVSDIANFGVAREVTSNGQGHVGFVNRVDVILKSGRPIKVCTTQSVHESRYVEKQLETFLNIENDQTFDDV